MILKSTYRINGEKRKNHTKIDSKSKSPFIFWTFNLANTNFVAQRVQFINLFFGSSVDCIMQILFLQKGDQILVIYFTLQSIGMLNLLMMYCATGTVTALPRHL